MPNHSDLEVLSLVHEFRDYSHHSADNFRQHNNSYVVSLFCNLGWQRSNPNTTIKRSNKMKWSWPSFLWSWWMERSTTPTATSTLTASLHAEITPTGLSEQRRPPGRPKGSKNKPKSKHGVSRNSSTQKKHKSSNEGEK